jgi:hypothetical protein
MAWFLNLDTGAEFDADPILEGLIRHDRFEQYNVLEIPGPGLRPNESAPAPADEDEGDLNPALLDDEDAPADETLQDGATGAAAEDEDEDLNPELAELTSAPSKPKGRPKRNA